MISVESIPNKSGVTIVDQIERRQYSLFTPEVVEPVPVDSDFFRFPIDTGVSIKTSSITLPNVPLIYIRDKNNEVITETGQVYHQTFSRDQYNIELCTPIKIYIRVETGVTIGTDIHRAIIEFDEECEVLVGARSKHDRPAGTVTTSDDPAEIMSAISSFGSALKTISPERSYPTLRGHPPLIERGDHLEVPPELSPPQTGIEIELPPTYKHAYVTAPLAYYFGATLVPGTNPRILTDTGFEHALDGSSGFERECETVLKRAFFLDCLTRTEGLYQLPLHEREVVEHEIGLDFASLYHRSLGEQLAAYLTVPYDVIRPHIPEWKLTTHVAESPQSVETLPFLVKDLAIIRTPGETHGTSAAPEVAIVSDFLRDSFVRSSAETAPSRQHYVQPERVNSLEHAWVGDEIPLGASKELPEAYLNALHRTLSDGTIDITIVCNDPKMATESDLVDTVYGSRTELPFEVSVYKELTCDEFGRLLAKRSDFLHYIGHIDADGFECADDKLDASTLETVEVDSFFLNACQSYEQGLNLIKAGGIGGIATVSNVINSGAVTMGGTVARLLNSGFPLRVALDISKTNSVVGHQYIVLGDGGFTIAQAESVIPNLCTIERIGDNLYDLELKSFVTTLDGMGSVLKPYIGDNSRYFLNSGKIHEFTVTKDELCEFLRLEEIPVELDGNLYWSSEFDTMDL